jgi:hypothetical protein
VIRDACLTIRGRGRSSSARLACRASHRGGCRGICNGEFARVVRRSPAHPVQRNRSAVRATAFCEQRAMSIRFIFRIHKKSIRAMRGRWRLFGRALWKAVHEQPEQHALQRIRVRAAKRFPCVCGR